MPQHSHSAVTSKKSSAKSNKSSTAKDSKGTRFSSAQSIGNEEDRHDMIATAAYYRAEQRGFNSGFEMEDWLAAEAEIDGMLYH